MTKKLENLQLMIQGLLATVPILNWSAKKIIDSPEVEIDTLKEIVQSYIDIVEKLTEVIESANNHITEEAK